MTLEKEYFLKLLNEAIDGQLRLNKRAPGYCVGIKHVRELFDHTFGDEVAGEDLLEFSVGIICSIQPEEPRRNRYLAAPEQGILAAAYFLYSAMQPLVLEPSPVFDEAGEWPTE